MRRAAVVAAAALGLAACTAPGVRPARAEDGFLPFAVLPASAVDELDGEQFLVGEPIWLCPDAANEPATFDAWFSHRFVLVGADDEGRVHRQAYDAHGAPEGDGEAHTPRGGELAQTFGFADPSGRVPLLTTSPGVPAGSWELRRAEGDTARVLARFRVLEPRGAERFVRDGLARAARLVRAGTREQAEQAARLYEAILHRYPRTTYLGVVYAGLWRTRAHTRFADDPDRWLEEIFARFHDSCFGTVALDQWVRDMGEERAKKTVARLVGIYPDTPLSRAARRYL